MQKEKNNKGLIVLVIALIIIILGLIGFIVYDKLLKNERIGKKYITNTPIIETSNITSEETIKDIYNLPLSNDDSLIAKIKTNDNNFNIGENVIYNQNEQYISNVCTKTTDPNKKECIFKYNNKDIYNYFYYINAEAETDYYIIYILKNNIIFTRLNGMTIGFDFFITNNQGEKIYDTFNVSNTSEFMATKIYYYSQGENSSDDDLVKYNPLLINNNKIYFVYLNEKENKKNTFYYIDLNSKKTEPIIINEISSNN